MQAKSAFSACSQTPCRAPSQQCCILSPKNYCQAVCRGVPSQLTRPVSAVHVDTLLRYVVGVARCEKNCSSCNIFRLFNPTKRYGGYGSAFGLANRQVHDSGELLIELYPNRRVHNPWGDGIHVDLILS